MSLLATGIASWLSLVVANFLYQYMTKSDWSAAFERSYFMGVAILVLCLTLAWQKS